MKIYQMFEKNVDRNINGVVKVAQDDLENLRQELDEYVVTRELARQFRDFFNAYAEALDEPTDKIGVWISGFFGSGKSHFLKTLSYLLANKEVDGKKTLDYFSNKFDATLWGDALRCVAAPTESILFNIDVECPGDKDKTAVLRVFAKMFYKHCGFYGDDLKVARLERFIEKQGKTELFRATFEKNNGSSWLEARDSFAFFEDDVVETLRDVLGMSEQAARNWFNGEETSDLSIARLVEEIREYVDSKGKNFRLLFMADEAGQFIGDDGNLMLNLQSLVEEIGSKCRGQVWVMVTSQEAIDSVVGIKGENDFSKIQGRFNTRLSLSSSSVDEVIKKRVLAKTDEARQFLEAVYEKEQNALQNLYSFSNSKADVKGFRNAVDFAECYPFIPYQFIILPKVFAEIRKHGNSGKHLSGGERSLLSGFLEAAQKTKNEDEKALAPFYRFYDSVHTFLDGSIRRVIERCQRAADNDDGVKPEDVDVLKLLYLIRYVDDIRADVDNIAILMVDAVDAKILDLRKRVAESLKRLESQNYVAQNADSYMFLTDLEKDVALEIKRTPLENAEIVRAVGETVFDGIFRDKKFKYGKYDFAFNRYIDDVAYGTVGDGMSLRLLTVASDDYNASEERLAMQTSGKREAVLRLSDATPYYETLERALKICKYAMQHDVSKFPPNIRAIVEQRLLEATTLKKRAQEYVERAIADGKVYVDGQRVDVKGDDAKSKLVEVLTRLTENVYSNLNLVGRFVEGDDDIRSILRNGEPEDQPTFEGVELQSGVEGALREIERWLGLQHTKNLKVSMGEIQRRYGGIPFGWREIDVAALVVRLLVRNKIVVKYGGSNVGRNDKRLVDFLRKKTEIDKTTVQLRVAASATTIRQCVEFLREYLDKMGVPSDEQKLVAFAVDALTEKRAHYAELLSKYGSSSVYPGKTLVEKARDLTDDALGRRNDPIAFLKRLVELADDFFDASERMENVEAFFATQRPIFDEAQAFLSLLEKERGYFEADPASLKAFATVEEILASPEPYGRIAELQPTLGALKVAWLKLIDEKRQAVDADAARRAENARRLVDETLASDALKNDVEAYFAAKRQAIQAANSLLELDATTAQIVSFEKEFRKRIVELQTVAPPQPTRNDDKDKTPTPPVPPKPPRPLKIATVRIANLGLPMRLRNETDLDNYVARLRNELLRVLQTNDEILFED